MTPNAKHLPADARRAEIVETTVDLAGQRNPEEITTAAIAKRIGLTQGALFRHFPSKDAIWQAVAEWVADRLLARIERATEEVSSPLAALEAAFQAHLEFVASHPGVPRLILGELQREGDSPAKRVVRTLLRRYGEKLEALIEAGKAEGEVALDIDTSAAATLFIGMIQGLVMQALFTDEIQRIGAGASATFAVYRCGIARTR